MSARSSQFQPLEVLGLRDHIKQHIRDAIISGVFKPNERLVEATIADQLGVSRSPVREALSVLELEGLIVNLPRKGYHVISFTATDIAEIYSLRIILETAALQRCIERITPQSAAELQAIVNEIGVAAHQQNERERLVALDLFFHDRMCQLAEHSRLYSAWKSMHLQTALLISITSTTHSDFPDQHQQIHQQILDAMLAGATEQAEELLRKHIGEAELRARLALQEYWQEEQQER